MQAHHTSRRDDKTGQALDAGAATFRDIYKAIESDEKMSQGELHFLRRAIVRKLRAGSLRLDVEDLDLRPYYRAF